MTAEVRQDKFQAGDMVTMIAGDDYTDDCVQQGFWSQHGRGPQPVEEVEPVSPNDWFKPTAEKMARHTQYVHVHGHRYSGHWFNPVRAPE